MFVMRRRRSARIRGRLPPITKAATCAASGQGVNYAALDQVSPAATCRCVQTSIAYSVRWPLRHRQLRSRVASAVRIAGSTQGIRSVDSPLDDLFECSNTSRSCYRPGAKMGSHPAKSRQESGGVWPVICPGNGTSRIF